MILTTGTYTDFKLVVLGLGNSGPGTIIYYFESGGNLFAVAIVNGQIGVSVEGVPIPASFATDFPNAIATTNNVTIS